MSWWPFGSKASRATPRDPSDRARTFDVDSVDPNLDPIALVSADDVWRSRGISALESQDALARPYVACEPIHGLLAAVHLAYAEHRPLVLAPEDLWLCVLQAIARVIEEQPERYRSLFVAHEGKEAIAIRRDEFVPGSRDNDWGGAIAELGEGVRARSSERAQSFLAPSGASAVGAIACDVSLLGAMQSYFSLEVHTMCGIPSITLEGSPAEWSELRQRTALLRELGLTEWQASLEHVLDRIIESAEGSPNARFWKEIYKREEASGGPRMSGWINALFPFLTDRGTSQRNPLAHFGKHWPKHALEGISASSLPAGMSNAPFDWVLLGQRKPMSFVAGFTGVTQEPDGAVRARLGWAVTERAEWRRFSVQREHTLAGVPTLSPRPGEVIRDAHGIADEASGLDRWAVEFTFCQSLVSLDGIQPSPGLVSIGTLSSRVPTLEPLRDHPTLERLWLHQDEALVDIRALESLPALRRLAINHCTSLRDLRPLLALDRLDELSLHGTNIPRDAAGMHRGRDAVLLALSKLRSCIAH